MMEYAQWLHISANTLALAEEEQGKPKTDRLSVEPLDAIPVLPVADYSLIDATS